MSLPPWLTERERPLAEKKVLAHSWEKGSRSEVRSTPKEAASSCGAARGEEWPVRNNARHGNTESGASAGPQLIQRVHIRGPTHFCWHLAPLTSGFVELLPLGLSPSPILELPAKARHTEVCDFI